MIVTNKSKHYDHTNSYSEHFQSKSRLQNFRACKETFLKQT